MLKVLNGLCGKNLLKPESERFQDNKSIKNQMFKGKNYEKN